MEDRLYMAGWLVLAVGAAGIFVYFRWILPNNLIPPCFFYHVLGIYCPGCGGTRAVGALLNGNVLLSLWYHPLVPYTAAVFGGFMLTQTLARTHIAGVKGWKFHNWYLYAAIIIVAVNWIVKNILLHFCNILI